MYSQAEVSETIRRALLQAYQEANVRLSFSSFAFFFIIYDPISLKMARQPLAIKIPAQGQLYG